jgi:probable F420-dependent oxidoreductase
VTPSTTRHPIRIGVQLRQQHTTYQSYADAVRRAEDLGVDTIWNWDHFFPLTGDPQGGNFEGWTLLTAMATLTQRAEIGCLVTCNSYRNPTLLADMAKTVDHISNGRLILGIGAGWFERDYQEYRYEFGTAGSRLDSLEKGLEIIKYHWEVCAPKPMRNPIPILLGGGGEKVTLRLVAQYATISNTFGDPPTFAHKMQVLDTWCTKVGRNPHEIERSISLPSSVSLSQLDAYVQAGATHLIAEVDTPWNFDFLRTLVRWRNERNSLF